MQYVHANCEIMYVYHEKRKTVYCTEIHAKVYRRLRIRVRDGAGEQESIPTGLPSIPSLVTFPAARRPLCGTVLRPKFCVAVPCAQPTISSYMKQNKQTKNQPNKIKHKIKQTRNQSNIVKQTNKQTSFLSASSCAMDLNDGVLRTLRQDTLYLCPVALLQISVSVNISTIDILNHWTDMKYL